MERRFQDCLLLKTNIREWTKPAEPLSWDAVPSASNHLPAKFKGPTGDLPTGAHYDDWGRLKEVLAIPGDLGSLTTWQYDSQGRVITENGVEFLLDGEGLRFRRKGDNGYLRYTIYGFDREPLSAFEANGAPGGEGRAAKR